MIVLAAFSEVGYFAGHPLSYIEGRPIPWFKGKPPVAVPKCGFDDQFCRPKDPESTERKILAFRFIACLFVEIQIKLAFVSFSSQPFSFFLCFCFAIVH